MENFKSKSTNRVRKPRTIQMKYPAPYSHSWSSTDPLQNVSSKMKKSTSFQGNKQRIIQPQCCWSRPKPITTGCDPYAPHLKYGVFPRKIRRDTNFETAPKQPEMENITIDKRHMLRDGKKKNNKGQHSDTPLFVIRPIDKRLTHQLSSSGVMHVDIKPQLAGKFSEYKNMSKFNGTNRFLRNKAY